MNYFSCENCGNNQFVATSVGIFCDSCGVKYVSKPTKTINILSMFSDVIEAALSPMLKNQLGSGQPSTIKKCAKCGTTWNDIYMSGRMGCADDYELFAEELRPWLIKAHGRAKHKPNK